MTLWSYVYGEEGTSQVYHAVLCKPQSVARCCWLLHWSHRGTAGAVCMGQMILIFSSQHSLSNLPKMHSGMGESGLPHRRKLNPRETGPTHLFPLLQSQLQLASSTCGLRGPQTECLACPLVSRRSNSSPGESKVLEVLRPRGSAFLPHSVLTPAALAAASVGPVAVTGPLIYCLPFNPCSQRCCETSVFLCALLTAWQLRASTPHPPHSQ